MKKRLIAIVLSLFVMAFMPLTAQAATPTDYELVVSMQVSPGPGSDLKSPGEPSYAMRVDPGIMLGTIGAGSGGLFDADPATIVAANDNCGSCHSANRDVPSGVHGGGTRAGITTS